jgi:hypothetical protein
MSCAPKASWRPIANASSSRPDRDGLAPRPAALAPIFLALSSLLGGATGAARAEPAPAAVKAAQEAAHRLHLADERAWQKLLFMADRVLSDSSFVTTRDFFNADPESGDWSPEAELDATIAALVAVPSATGEAADKTAFCRFPARRAWLAARLPALAAALPKLPCPALDEYMGRVGEESLSLVFSSYFANNPASLFGHSFLRLGKRPRPGEIHSEMLDDSINFQAYPDEDWPLLYPIRGVFGRFPGKFSIEPMFMKIQQYNNADSRDLWDYELAFDREDIRSLKRVIWELGFQEIPYYYFDQNCSLILLKLLEAAKPTLDLPPLHPWIIPSDTLRVVARSPGLVKDVKFKASALTRFHMRYQALSDDERAVVDTLVTRNDPALVDGELHFLQPQQVADVIDAAVEFIDFDERLAGSAVAEKRGALRRELLETRAKIRVAKREVPIPVNPALRPDVSGGTTRLVAAAGRGTESGGILQAEWRPALHDLAEPDLSYSEGLAITFFDTVLRYDTRSHKGFLERYDLFTVKSVPHLEAITSPFSWSVFLGADNIGSCADITLRCFDKHAGTGIGPLFDLGRGSLYGQMLGQIGSSGEPGLEAYAAFGPTVGVVWPLSPYLKLTTSVMRQRRFGEHRFTDDVTRAHFDAAWLASEAHQLRLSVERKPRETEVLASYYYEY